MDKKDINPENEIEIVAEAIIDSFTDEPFEPIPTENLAKAIEVGASTLVGIETDDDENDESNDTKKSKKKKLKGSFFLGFVSLLFALLSILCCCVPCYKTPFVLPIAFPIQVLFIVLAIVFLTLDKKYNGKSSFSVSAILGIIFSICIVILTLLWVCIMLIFGIGVRLAFEEQINQFTSTITAYIDPIIKQINS